MKYLAAALLATDMMLFAPMPDVKAKTYVVKVLEKRCKNAPPPPDGGFSESARVVKREEIPSHCITDRFGQILHPIGYSNERPGHSARCSVHRNRLGYIP